jgi:UDP-glucose 4-epimerase
MFDAGAGDTQTLRFEEFYASKRVMVTGGLGFIGSNLAHRLVGLGADVLLVDSLVHDYGGNPFNIRDIKDRVQVNVADMRDEHSLSILVAGQECIFNLAGQVSHLDSMRDPYTDLDINCRSQLSLLEACRRNNPAVKIVYASTRQIYGRPSSLPVDENHLIRPTDVNGINKMAGEWYHILYNNVYGIRACSLRLTNTFGPRQLMKHSRQGFLPWFIRLALENQNIRLYGGGTQIRDVNYVDDVVDAFLLAGMSDAADGQIFNLGGDPPISLRRLTEMIVQIANSGSYSSVPFPDDRKAIDVGDFYADYSKITRALGWRPRVPLAEGLERTINFYRHHWHHYWETSTGGNLDTLQRPGPAASPARASADGGI